MTKIAPAADDAPAKGKTATVDEATRLTGVGLFHWVLVIASGMCSASVVFEVVSPSYLLSPVTWATCDLDMDATDKSILGAIVFIGMLVGTHLWGVVADSWGRVPLIRCALLADATVGVLSSLVPDKRLFIAARFFNGFLVAGPTSASMAYLGEFHGEQSRAKAMLILGLFPGGASLVAAGLAYLVLPLHFAPHLPWIGVYRPWRLFVLLSSMPALLTGLAFLWFPESPRFLLSTGRPEQAMQSLRTVYAMNKGSAKEYPVSALVTTLDGSSPAAGNRLLAVWRQTVPLFNKEHLRNTGVLCAVLFAVVCSANGLLVWLPEIFNRGALFAELYPDTPATACEAIQGLLVNASSVASARAVRAAGSPGGGCGGELQDAMFINTGTIGAANILVGVLGALAVNLVGKRLLLVLSLLAAGACGVLITVLQSSTATIVLACGLIALSSTCISVVVSVAVENYPTTLRATAVSLGMLLGRCGSMTGSFMFGALLESQCSAAFWGLSAMLIACGMLALLFPRRGTYAS